MAVFPGEILFKREIENELQDLLELSRNALIAWTDENKLKWINGSGFSQGHAVVVASIDMQLTRLYRTVFECCKRGEGVSATILSRALFETMLATLFLVKEKIYIQVEPVVNKQTKQPLKHSDGRLKYLAKVPIRNSKKHLLDRNFRGLLYCAYDQIVDLEITEKLKKEKGFKRIGNKRAKTLSSDTFQLLEPAIGPEWLSIARGKISYSGLNISDLASVIDKKRLRPWYNAIYKDLCHVTHAGAALRQLSIDEVVRSFELDYFTALKDIERILILATSLFLGAVIEILEVVECPNAIKLRFSDLSDSLLAINIGK